MHKKAARLQTLTKSEKVMMRDFASGRQKAYRMVVFWFGFVAPTVSLHAR
jgi:hypothetical protein